MPLYAVDEDDLIYAGDAESGKIYWCLDCFSPVKKRRGKNGLPHFYHTKRAPSCRLYSKSEDHLLAQLQLQKSFPESLLQIERPFIQIDRVADLCWEKEKVVFEIQCSPITEKEVEMRTNDYRSIGYEVIWLLDDKRYNKKALRPAEEHVRTLGAYYLSIKPGLHSFVYDQFEFIDEGKRLKRGKRMPLDLQEIRNRPRLELNEEFFPKQIISLKNKKYIAGDRIDRALKNHQMTMKRWKTIEIELSSKKRKTHFLLEWMKQKLLFPYMRALERGIKRLDG